MLWYLKLAHVCRSLPLCTACLSCLPASAKSWVCTMFARSSLHILIFLTSNGGLCWFREMFRVLWHAVHRELAEDGQLSQKFRPLYVLMRSAAAKPAPAAAADRGQSILEVSSSLLL